MTVKQAIEFGIAMGMKSFQVKHYKYNGEPLELTIDAVLNLIKGYEKCLVMTCYFGSAYSYTIPSVHYQRPDLCYIVFRLEEEEIPTQPCN